MGTSGAIAGAELVKVSDAGSSALPPRTGVSATVAGTALVAASDTGSFAFAARIGASVTVSRSDALNLKPLNPRIKALKTAATHRTAAKPQPTRQRSFVVSGSPRFRSGLRYGENRSSNSS